MKNRRDFLKTACKPVVLATLGIPLLEACSSEELSTTDSTVNSNSGATERAPLTVNISSGDFTGLQEVGGWLNYTGENLLLVRISEEVIRVFDNKCPHQGNRDQLGYMTEVSLPADITITIPTPDSCSGGHSNVTQLR